MPQHLAITVHAAFANGMKPVLSFDCHVNSVLSKKNETNHERVRYK